ncbi:tRNA (uracil-5-)-methyltransferase [Geosmithia morbida]|uniref:tRNA (uracil(54)-C(5))-methyltransferase n=1 Tax=Geosmithia morbida TaxID=1094350 RepID=A0A9P4Z3C2_9HYPO|nr:tRNA (uracil-5-)-methyltransferase [Geosmithia morbida]KAF4125879.1 tRNA (uracil-5-)-methyltransferase [Geosmithia morbida]
MAAVAPAVASTPIPEVPAQSQEALSHAQVQAQAQTDESSAMKRPQKRAGGGQGNGGKWKPKKTKREKNIAEGSSEDIMRIDIETLIESRAKDCTEEVEQDLPAEGTETEVEILDLSSTSEGLGMRAGSDQVYVVPFTVPGDIVRVKVFRHLLQDRHTIADLVSVVKPSALRDDARVRCKYFGACGGCQFQMLDYDEQLKLKRRILDKAYRNFSNLPAELVPVVQDTIGSPLQYGYRTKLTPHFDGPPGSGGRKKKNPPPTFDKCPDIGFMLKGKRRVMDIEDCPIGTDAVRLGMKRERTRMRDEYAGYKRGATLLLRENTSRYPKNGPDADPAAIPAPEADPPYTTRTETDSFVDIKSCVTDSKATTTEYIDDYTFTNPAGSFFQNNNSILPRFTSYIRDHILPPSSSDSSNIKYLIDSYSGSGLFTITLSKVFQRSTGIDIAADSIASARKNARLNGLGFDDSDESQRCNFIAADAGQLFRNVSYNPDETVVVLDPPRKGCDEDFLSQLRNFGPKRVVYVSCNVHTQARDVGILVRGEGEGKRYVIESLRGFDFFPQTGHVEGVAILNRVEE